MKKNLKNLVFSAMFLALCMVLPLITGGIEQIGNAISPMHIPVLICGFVCGWQYGAVVGFVAPLLRSALFGMPVMYPVAAAMAFELTAYGLACGIMYKLMPKKNWCLYPSLIVSMLLGRLVWGAARYVMAGIDGSAFSFAMFLEGAFVTALPAIICHIAVVPPIVMLLKKIK